MPVVRKGAIVVVILALGYLLAMLPARSAPATPVFTEATQSVCPGAAVD